MPRKFIDKKPFPLAGISAQEYNRKNHRGYFYHEERFLQRPFLNATLAAATPNAAEIAASFSANKNWEILGTNAADADVTALEGGGIAVATAGADNDQVIIRPHLDTNQSMLAGMNWDSANQPWMRVDFLTAASIADMQFWFGYRSTDSVGEVTPAAVIADPADQFMLMYSDEGATSTTAWTSVSTRTGTDTETLAYPDSDATSTGITLVASTLYRLEMWLDKDRKPHYYINDQEVANGDNTALTAVSTLDPYFAVQALTGSAKTINIRSVAVSQLYG